MKTKKLTLALVLFAALALLQAASDNESYKIGDKGPAGGIIFYDKGNSNDGWRYLEAAPRDRKGRYWAFGNPDITGTETGIGSGKRNTELILAQDPDAPAAKVCKDLNTGGKNDWFLPSKDELDLMCYNLNIKGLGNFENGWYWSSSQYSNDCAWLQHFGNGVQDCNEKNYPYAVRAVRAF